MNHMRAPLASPEETRKFLACTLLLCQQQRERPIYTGTAQVFQLDAASQQRWLEQSTRPVSIHIFYDSARRIYRIIAVEGSKPVLNSRLDSGLTISRASSKFLQLVQKTTVYGLGFADEHLLKQFMDELGSIKVRLESSCDAVIDEDNNEVETQQDVGCVRSVDNLKVENEQLKEALTSSCTNAKKWEMELLELKTINEKLRNEIRLVKGAKEETSDPVKEHSLAGAKTTTTNDGSDLENELNQRLHTLKCTAQSLNTSDEASSETSTANLINEIDLVIASAGRLTIEHRRLSTVTTEVRRLHAAIGQSILRLTDAQEAIERLLAIEPDASNTLTSFTV